MIWIIVASSILVVSLLFYIFYPSLKAKFALNRINQNIKSKDKKNNVNFTKFSKDAEEIENKDIDNKKEDPDTKIDYENFDLGGLFDEDKDSEESIDKEEDNDENPYLDKFEDFFNKYITDPKETQPQTNNPFRMRSKDWAEDDDINELLKGSFSGSAEDVEEQFNGLSDEMKALVLSNFLNRKE
ncbi:MAG: hypothetical protein PHS54_05085 [Clostridia bacterium]|nr:hypothetical protein [Clostridia bacterium]